MKSFYIILIILLISCSKNEKPPKTTDTNTTNTSLNEDSPDPTRNTTTSPVQETITPPAQETTTLPAQETTTLPAQETTTPPVQETTTPPVQEELDRDLIEGVESGDANKIQTALDQGANVNMINRYGSTPLQLAVISNKINVIDVLLSHKGIEVNFPKDWPPLMIASSKCRDEAVKSLFNHENINVNLRSGEIRITPLMAALRSNCRIVVELFLTRNDINLDILDIYNNSVYEYANYTANKTEVKRLLKNYENDR